MHAAGLDDGTSDIDYCFHGECEGDALSASGGGVYRADKADHAAIGREKRSSAISGIYERVGLYHAGNDAIARTFHGPSKPRYDAAREGVGEAIGMADGIDVLADGYGVRGSRGDGRKSCHVRLQHGHIGERVASHEPRHSLATIVEAYGELLSASCHMVVGDDVSIGGEYHAGTVS